MADELHLELDALRDAFWDRSELSRPLVFVSQGEPPDHVRALMRTLGVRIEVQPVTATSSKRGADATTPASAFAAQDYRASIASVHRREQAGDQAVTCRSCGTETDVTKIAHSPSCPSYPPPEPATKAKAKASSDGPGQPVWEKSRTGGRRSTRERNAAGELSSGEMQRRHEAVLDQAATVTSCAFAGCEWRFEGGALECREAAAAHRAADHPDAAKARRSRFPKPGQSNTQAGLEQGRDALEAMDAGLPQPKADTKADISPAEKPANGSTAAPTVRAKWTPERIIEAIQTYAADHGCPPGADDWRLADPQQKRPTVAAVQKLFGKWSSGIEAAGFPRPRRGQNARAKRSGPGPLAQQPPLVTDHRLTSPTPPVATGERGSGPGIVAESAADRITLVLKLIEVALRRAVERFPVPFSSPHEGWAVVKEEERELMLEVFENRGREKSAIAEAVQVAAMGARYVLDLGGAS